MTAAPRRRDRRVECLVEGLLRRRPGHDLPIVHRLTTIDSSRQSVPSQLIDALGRGSICVDVTGSGLRVQEAVRG